MSLISRRTFQGRVLVIGLSCMFGETVAAAEGSTMPGAGRPPLTVDTLNELIRKVLPPDGGEVDQAFAERALLARRDWQALLISEFRMTTQQLRNMRAMPRSEVRSLQKIILQAVGDRQTLVFQVTGGKGKGTPAQVCPRFNCHKETMIGPGGFVVGYVACGLSWNL